jgi:hypothetical protein
MEGRELSDLRVEDIRVVFDVLESEGFRVVCVRTSDQTFWEVFNTRGARVAVMAVPRVCDEARDNLTTVLRLQVDRARGQARHRR